MTQNTNEKTWTHRFSGDVHVSTLSQRDLRRLRKEGLCYKSVPACLYRVFVNHLGEMRTGIGIINHRGGYEFYQRGSARPVTLFKDDILFFPLKDGRRSTCCCVFADFLDYLAYTACLEAGEKFTSDCDCIIVNTPKNFRKAIVWSDVYSDIHLLFPNNQYGRTMAKTMLTRNPRHAKDYSIRYRGYHSFRELAGELLAAKSEEDLL